MSGGGCAGKRRVMVVADPGRESAGALEWALSHAVLEHDDLLLLHVEPPAPPTTTTTTTSYSFSRSLHHGGGGGGGGAFSAFLRRPPSSGGGGGGGAEAGGGVLGEVISCEFLEAMRATCAGRQPRVRVQVERVEMEGRDKARTILAQAKARRVDLLVIGQRRTTSSFLGCKLSGSMSSKGTETAEFLIENSKCLCVGVQKKGQNAGYLLNTKTHKNFWLLA